MPGAHVLSCAHITCKRLLGFGCDDFLFHAIFGGQDFFTPPVITSMFMLSPFDYLPSTLPVVLLIYHFTVILDNNVRISQSKTSGPSCSKGG